MYNKWACSNHETENETWETCNRTEQQTVRRYRSTKEWAKEHIFTHEAYRCKDELWCSECGGTWIDTSNSELGTTLLSDTTECPYCHHKLDVKISRKRKVEEEKYMSILQTAGEFQIIRHILCCKYVRKGIWFEQQTGLYSLCFLWSGSGMDHRRGETHHHGKTDEYGKQRMDIFGTTEHKGWIRQLQLELSWRPICDMGMDISKKETNPGIEKAGNRETVPRCTPLKTCTRPSERWQWCGIMYQDRTDGYVKAHVQNGLLPTPI